MIKILPFEVQRFNAETLLLIVKVYCNFFGMTHNVQHICELPPLYEVERGLGVSTKVQKVKMKRCV